MLASVYSYRVMVKSVSSCCVRGRRFLSNPVKYEGHELVVQHLIKSGADISSIDKVANLLCMLYWS